MVCRGWRRVRCFLWVLELILLGFRAGLGFRGFRGLRFEGVWGIFRI